MQGPAEVEPPGLPVRRRGGGDRRGDLLSAAHADVVLSGHNHNYSRWLPMDANGNPHPNGITQFIVGSGGRNLNGFGGVHTKPAAFATGWSNGFGYLQLRLRDGGYD